MPELSSVITCIQTRPKDRILAYGSNSFTPNTRVRCTLKYDVQIDISADVVYVAKISGIMVSKSENYCLIQLDEFESISIWISREDRWSPRFAQCIWKTCPKEKIRSEWQ